MVQLVDNLIERVFPRIRRRPLIAYPIALAIFGVAAVARVALSKWTGDTAPFLTFFTAVLIAAVVAGTGPGLLVVAASLAFSWYFYFPGPGWLPHSGTTLAALGGFAVFSAMVLAVAHLLNRKVEGLLSERSRNEALLQDSALGEMQLEQLNGELRHRLKNTFAVIGGLVSQSARFSRDVPTFANALSGRLSAMGNAMDLVATRSFTGASLNDLISETLKPLVPPGRRRLDMRGPDTIVPSDVASALALTLHELGTNAIKYGAWSNERGTVRLHWSIEKRDYDDQHFELTWTERGGPAVGEPERRGLGSTLIESGFPTAQVERQFNEDGVQCRIVAVMKQPTTRRTRGRAALSSLN